MSDQLRSQDEDPHITNGGTLKYKEFVKILESDINSKHDLLALKKLSNATRPSKTPNLPKRQDIPGFNIRMRVTQAKKARRLKPINAYGNEA